MPVKVEMDTMTHSKFLPLACIPGQPQNDTSSCYWRLVVVDHADVVTLLCDAATNSKREIIVITSNPYVPVSYIIFPNTIDLTVVN